MRRNRNGKDGSDVGRVRYGRNRGIGIEQQANNEKK